MGRTVDQIIRDTLGNLQLQIIQLTAQLEAADPPADNPPKTPQESERDHHE